MVENCLVQALAYHPDGRILAAGGVDWLATSGLDGAVALWDVAMRTRIVLLPGATTSLAFDPSGEFLAVGSLGRSVHVWHVPSQRMVLGLEGHEGTITSVVFSRDGRFLATSSDDLSVRLWTAGTWRRGPVIRVDTRVKALAFSPDGSYLYTSNGNATCYGIQIGDLNG
jgi:WD40 repeat protein